MSLGIEFHQLWTNPNKIFTLFYFSICLDWKEISLTIFNVGFEIYWGDNWRV